MFENREIYRVLLEGEEKPIYLDPMSIRRTLMTQSSGRCWEWIRSARAILQTLKEIPDDDFSEKAIATRAELSMRQSVLEGDLADAAYHAFGFEPIDAETGEGITETQILRLLTEYVGWVESKKESAGISPTS